MKLERSSGILLHITSLPGPEGCGTLGDEAYRFADFLKSSGMTYWQILPIGPVSPAMHFSPYASPSTFAGNWFFISMKHLAEKAWCRGSGIMVPEFEESHFCSYEDTAEKKMPFLRKAYALFFKNASEHEIERFELFCRENSFWLEDYALFAALALQFGTNAWLKWDEDIKRREPKALAHWEEAISAEIKFRKFIQFVFFSQWQDLRNYCADAGIKIIGDIPIYVNLEGADAWANPGIFRLDENEKPETVSGVPPDYFSATGQRWGNPIYRWFTENGGLHPDTLSWWTERIRHLTEKFDVLRIDHFRGFESYWSIPAEEHNAVRGTWESGPGRKLFDSLSEDLGELRLIAEDLGIITPQVENLRDSLDFPGMKILQFAFDGNSRNPYLTHSIENPNCILYTGTHDNNTTNGWFYGPEINEATRRRVMEYIGTETFSDMHISMIREAYKSVARLAVIPMQDVLGFGAEHRMNTPGTTEGNWLWRCRSDCLSSGLSSRLRKMADIYNRNGQ